MISVEDWKSHRELPWWAEKERRLADQERDNKYKCYECEWHNNKRTPDGYCDKCQMKDLWISASTGKSWRDTK